MSSSDVIVRLRMLGAAAFTAAASTAAGGVRGIGDAADDTTGRSGKLNGALNKMSGPLSALSSMAATAATGLAAAGAAATVMGVKYNASMEQSRVAFTELLGSQQAANEMLDQIADTAAKTPFETAGLVQFSQRLLGVGFAAKDIIPTMTTLGDAVAGTGGGQEELAGITRALTQIQTQGRLSTEELNQMSERGVPALKILSDQLGLTGGELRKQIESGAISSDKAIDALLKGMQKRYGGMSEAQSKTFNGMISNIKDVATRMAGELTAPLFEQLRSKVLPGIQQLFESGAIQKFARGAMKVLGDAFKAVIPYVQQLIDALKPMAPFVQNILWPLLKGFGIGVLGSLAGALKIIIPLIKLLAQGLGFIGRAAAPISPWIEKVGIVLGVVFGPAVLKAIGYLSKFGGLLKWIGYVAKALRLPFVALGRVFGLVGKALGAFMNRMLYAGGVATKFAARVLGIVAKLGNLPSKFASLAGRAFTALTKPFAKLGSVFTSFGRTIIEAIVNGIKSMPGAVWDAIKSGLPGKAKGLLDKAFGALPLARGGIVQRAGMALVGERGPELVTLGAGARVMPLPSASVAPIPGINASYGDGGTVVVPVYLDGRVITEVVAQRTADRRARR